MSKETSDTIKLWIPIMVAFIGAVGVIIAALLDSTPTVVQIGKTELENTVTISIPTPSQTSESPTPSAIDNRSPTRESTQPHTLTPEPIAAFTLTPEPTSHHTPTPEPTPTGVETPEADAVVLDGGAQLRPGATTWWYPRQTLPAGTELKLVGHDPDFPGWVYVCTNEGTAEGWTQVANLQVNRDLIHLPRVTPRPTLTSTPSHSPTLTPGDGRLTLQLYHDPGSEECLPGSGWKVNIHFIVEGGTGVYTYFWEGAQIYGPTTDKEYIYTVEWGDAALSGTGRVESGGEAVQDEVYVPELNCH